jgi:hypothetical protein
VTPRKVLLDAINVRLVGDGGRAETAAALGAFAREQVAFAGVTAHDFAGASDLKSLGHGFFGLDAFGTSHKFNFSYKRARTLGGGSALCKLFFDKLRFSEASRAAGVFAS